MICGRSEGANSGIRECVEELKEHDAVKDQCRCHPTEQEPGAQGRSNVYSSLSGLEDVAFNDFEISSRMILFQKMMVKSRQVLHPFLTLKSWRQRSRRSKESRISVMFLKHWVSASVTPECLLSV